MTPALEAGRECDAAVAVDVMGLSLLADTDQRIGDAVIGGLISSNGPDGTADVTWNGLRYNGVPFIAGAYNRGASGNSGHGLAWWRDRQGKPWQSDLEAHSGCVAILSDWILNRHRRSDARHGEDARAASRAH